MYFLYFYTFSIISSFYDHYYLLCICCMQGVGQLSTLYLRIPFWTYSKSAKATLNGQTLPLTSPGKFPIIYAFFFLAFSFWLDSYKENLFIFIEFLICRPCTIHQKLVCFLLHLGFFVHKFHLSLGRNKPTKLKASCCGVGNRIFKGVYSCWCRSIRIH